MIKHIYLIFLCLLKIIYSLRYNGGPIVYGAQQIPLGIQQNSYQQLLPFQYQKNVNFGMPISYSPYQLFSPYTNVNGMLGNYLSYSPFTNPYFPQVFNSYNPSSSYNFMIPNVNSSPYTSTYSSSNIFGYTNPGISTNGGLTGASIAGYPSLATSYITNYPYNKKT